MQNQSHPVNASLHLMCRILNTLTCKFYMELFTLICKPFIYLSVNLHINMHTLQIDKKMSHLNL